MHTYTSGQGPFAVLVGSPTRPEGEQQAWQDGLDEGRGPQVPVADGACSLSGCRRSPGGPLWPGSMMSGLPVSLFPVPGRSQGLLRSTVVTSSRACPSARVPEHSSTLEVLAKPKTLPCMQQLVTWYALGNARHDAGIMMSPILAALAPMSMKRKKEHE